MRTHSPALHGVRSSQVVGTVFFLGSGRWKVKITGEVPGGGALAVCPGAGPMTDGRRSGTSRTCYAARLLEQALAAPDALEQRARIVEPLVGALCSVHARFWCGLKIKLFNLSCHHCGTEIISVRLHFLNFCFSSSSRLLPTFFLSQEFLWGAPFLHC